MKKEIKDFIKAAEALNKIGEVLSAEYSAISEIFRIQFAKRETIDNLVANPKVSPCITQFFYGTQEDSKLHIFSLISAEEAIKLGYDIYSPEEYKPKKEDICR